MDQLISIALLRPNKTVERELQLVFTGDRYKVKIFDTIEQIRQAQEIFAQEFSCYVIPLSNTGRNSLTEHVINRLKKEANEIPIVCLFWPETETILSQVFEAGITLAFAAPHKPELIYKQIEACIKERIRLQSHDSSASADFEREQLLCQIIDAQQEAILVIDDHSQELIRNRQAERLWQLFDSSEQSRFEQLLQQLLLKHIHYVQSGSGPTNISRTMRFTTNDGSTLQYSVDFQRLHGSNELKDGWIINVSDQQDIRFAGHLIGQAQRSFALNFLLLAAVNNLLEGQNAKAEQAPLERVEEILSSEENHSSLQATLFSLIEILDCIWPAGTQVRVDIDMEIEINLSRSTLTRLLGQLLLHAVIQAGIEGETEISSETSQRSQYQTIIITARSAISSNSLFAAPLTQAIQSSLSGEGNNEVLALDDTGSLMSLQKQLRKVGGTLDWKDVSSHEQEFILTLPCFN